MLNTLRIIGAAGVLAVTAAVLTVPPAPAEAKGIGDQPAAWIPETRFMESQSGYTLTGTPSCDFAVRCEYIATAWNNDGSYSLSTGSQAWPSWWAPGATFRVEGRSRATGSKGTVQTSAPTFGNYTRPVAQAPLRLIDPVAGQQYLPNQAYTFRGTATPGAAITAKDGDTVLFTATTDAAGNWSATREWGFTRTWVIDITQNPVGGTPETIRGFVWAPIDTNH
jgi:hypothetical protein